MDGRIECRVLRRSRGIVEIAEVEVCAEVEVWMGWRMEWCSADGVEAKERRQGEFGSVDGWEN